MHTCYSSRGNQVIAEKAIIASAAIPPTFAVAVLELLLKLIALRPRRCSSRWLVGLLFWLDVFFAVLQVNTLLNSRTGSRQRKSPMCCRVQQLHLFTYKSFSPELVWLFQSLCSLEPEHFSVLSTPVQQGQHTLSYAFELLPCCASDCLTADIGQLVAA